MRGTAAGSPARPPHVAGGLVVPLLFDTAGRVVRRVAPTAGGRTRLDLQLANLLRLGSSDAEMPSSRPRA